MASIKLIVASLTEVDEHAVPGGRSVSAEVVDPRMALVATTLYQMTWGKDAALTGLPEANRQAMAAALRDVADLLEPARLDRLVEALWEGSHWTEKEAKEAGPGWTRAQLEERAKVKLREVLVRELGSV